MSVMVWPASCVQPKPHCALWPLVQLMLEAFQHVGEPIGYSMFDCTHGPRPDPRGGSNDHGPLATRRSIKIEIEIARVRAGMPLTQGHEDTRTRGRCPRGHEDTRVRGALAPARCRPRPRRRARRRECISCLGARAGGSTPRPRMLPYRVSVVAVLVGTAAGRALFFKRRVCI